MLITNYRYNGNLCGHYHSGETRPYWVLRSETMRGFYYPSDVTNIEQNKRDSVPTGTNPPYSLILGDKGSLISSTTNINGVSTVISNVAMGRSIAANLSGEGVITSALSLIIQLATNLAGEGLLTSALVGSLQMAANLAGVGDLEVSAKIIANIVATLAGQGSISSATFIGFCRLEADITPYTELSPETLAASILNSMLTSYNSPGTVGQALNAAGSAGDPWIADLASYSGTQAGKVLSDIKTNAGLIPALL